MKERGQPPPANERRRKPRHPRNEQHRHEQASRRGDPAAKAGWPTRVRERWRNSDNCRQSSRNKQPLLCGPAPRSRQQPERRSKTAQNGPERVGGEDGACREGSVS